MAIGIVKVVGHRARLRRMDYATEIRKQAATVRRDAARADASRESFYELVRAALAAGLTQAEIARESGYTRERLRQIALKKD
jgi:hypothetical protein